MQQPKRILVCPLDWGLGHAARCIPVIRLLLEKNAHVIIAAGGRPLEMLKQEFPALPFIPFNGYGIRYPSSGSMQMKILFSIPRIMRGIRKEHEELKKIIRENNIDVVISDNRYGCYNANIKSIFITHQVMIKSPLAENLLHRIVLSYIKKFDECWIPDHAGENNLSADLSHKYPVPANCTFTGPLSRFKNPGRSKPVYDVMAVISGPEPQRSIFERLIAGQMYKSNLKALLVAGIPGENTKTEQKGNVTMVNHLNSAEMQVALQSSEIIISRSGYSTIMDLAALGKRAIFVPTPGQTEQEYLAAHFMKENIAYSVKQSAFNLEEALKRSGMYGGFRMVSSSGVLEEKIDSILS
ncbi:MAG TPA: glycosyltransferase [Bacteroidia bacterium]|jgi:uncharacterized protein (TIGR00661 family)